MASDFTTDGNCISVYPMESGALAEDILGNNDLTNSGVTSDTVDYKEGSGSGVSTAWGNMYLADSSLSSGFPCKSGESNLSFSIGGWLRPNSIPGGGADFLSKFDAFRLYQAGTDLQFWHYYAAGSIDSAVSLSSAFVEDQWSHVTATYDDSTKEWVLYSYVGGSLLKASGTFAHNGYASDGIFRVGCYHGSALDANLDEFFIFNRVLTQAEITKIINGTFPGVLRRRRYLIA